MKIDGNDSSLQGGVILFFGETSRPEFAPVVASCEEMIAAAPSMTMEEVRFLFDDFDVADELKKRSDRPCPALFFFESRPGEFPPVLIERIRQIHPMIPIVFIAGTACEGERRTGSPPPGTIRYYWHEWDSMGRKEFERFLEKKSSRFSLPLTATDEDYYRLSNDSDEEAPSPFLPFVRPEINASAPDCFVISPDHAMRELLLEWGGAHFERIKSASSLKQLLDQTFAHPERLRRIVVDSMEPNAENLFDDIKKIAERFPTAEVSLLLFSPRVEEIKLFTDAVLRLRILAKPFDIRALF